MPEHLDSVNGLLRQVRKWAQTALSQTNPARAADWVSTANALEAVIGELKELRRKTAPLPTKLGDLSDLPAELRAELSGIELDELESQLLTVINGYDGTADLNQILVGLWRKFQVVQKRRVLAQRLWRMQQDKLVWAVPKKKGMYTTKGATSLQDLLDEPTPAPKQAAARRDDLDDEIPF